MLKLNPDFEKKKISNVVDENLELKQMLKEALDEIESLHKEHDKKKTDQTVEMMRKSQFLIE